MTQASTIAPAEISDLIEKAKKLAREYRRRTGRPLGITGEVAEYEACRLLKLCLAPVRQEGFDAVRSTPTGEKRVQVKGRVVLKGSNPGQRLSRINLEHEWDSVVLVLLDENFDPITIYEADRNAVSKALSAPGSKSRNERGQLGLPKFKSISRQVWPQL